jgi:hypothetical protein
MSPATLYPNALGTFCNSAPILKYVSSALFSYLSYSFEWSSDNLELLCADTDVADGSAASYHQISAPINRNGVLGHPSS